MDDDEETLWLGGDDLESVNSKGKLQEAYHGNSQQNKNDTYDLLYTKGELDDDEGDDWSDGDDLESIDGGGKPPETYQGDSLVARDDFIDTEASVPDTEGFKDVLEFADYFAQTEDTEWSDDHGEEVSEGYGVRDEDSEIAW